LSKRKREKDSLGRFVRFVVKKGRGRKGKEGEGRGRKGKEDEDQMKIIKVDNLDREGPGHDDVLIAQEVDRFWGSPMVEMLNARAEARDPDADDFFKLVPDDYKLREFAP
jgi:hypothetical protein